MFENDFLLYFNYLKEFDCNSLIKFCDMLLDLIKLNFLYMCNCISFRLGIKCSSGAQPELWKS